VVAGLALAALFLPVVFGPDYRLTIEVAVPLGLAIMVLPFLHFAGTSLSVRNLYIHSITLSVVSAVTSVVGCLVLIPLFSVVGALWATLFALLARGLAAIVVLLRQERAEARAASHAA
jgi:O-antigen/teichoic acid export membrane protein